MGVYSLYCYTLLNPDISRSNRVAKTSYPKDVIYLLD